MNTSIAWIAKQTFASILVFAVISCCTKFGIVQAEPAKQRTSTRLEPGATAVLRRKLQRSGSNLSSWLCGRAVPAPRLEESPANILAAVKHALESGCGFDRKARGYVYSNSKLERILF